MGRGHLRQATHEDDPAQHARQQSTEQQPRRGGRGQHPAARRDQQRQQEQCDRRGIILAAPRAADLSGFSGGEAEFVKSLVEQMQREYAIDPARICIHGHAEGGLFAWNVGFDAELYVVSCTTARSQCENFRGDTSFGGQAQGALDVARLRFWRFVPFAAASVTGIVANGLVAAERRLLGRLGVYAQLGDSSLALFVLGSLGNDVGIVRLRTLNVVGAGLSFAR